MEWIGNAVLEKMLAMLHWVGVDKDQNADRRVCPLMPDWLTM
jgi:hypothetical protein